MDELQCKPEWIAKYKEKHILKPPSKASTPSQSSLAAQIQQLKKLHEEGQSDIASPSKASHSGALALEDELARAKAQLALAKAQAVRAHNI